MLITTTKTFAKSIASVTAFGLLAVSGLASPAYAQTTTTTADLQAQIAALLAQIAALQARIGVSGTVTPAFTRDLTIGSTGGDVTQLQTWLIGKGFSIPAGATGYFGTQTQAAVASYQAANGIAPAVGYFGPITRGRVNASLVVTVPTTPPPSTTVLTGNGRLTDISSVGDIESNLQEGDGLTKVTGFQAMATDGDVKLQRLDVQFDIGSSGSQSSNLDKYIDSVSLYMDGTKLATMDAADGDKDGRTWTFRFSDLGNAIIKEGDTANIYVEVTPVGSVGGNEENKSVTVSIPSDGVRAVGADGISDTYSVSGSSQTLTFSIADTGKLTLSTGNDNPQDMQVKVDANDTTTDVTLLQLRAKATNSDLDLNELPVSIMTSDDNLSDVIQTLKLEDDSGNVLRSKTVGTGASATIVFDNLDESISQDDTQTYKVVADLKRETAYSDGTTLTASTTNSLGGWDVEDANGNTSTLSGAAVGNTITLTSVGISITRGTPTQNVTAGLSGAGDIASFKIPFTVTAGDTDIYVSGVATKGTSGSGIRYSTTTTSTAGATGEAVGVSVTADNSVSGDNVGSYYKIPAGTSRTLTLNATYIATTTGPVTAGNVGLMINSIAYGTAPGALTSYFTSNLDTFKTNDVFVTKR